MNFLKKLAGKKSAADCCGVEIKEVQQEESDNNSTCCSSSEEQQESCCG